MFKKSFVCIHFLTKNKKGEKFLHSSSIIMSGENVRECPMHQPGSQEKRSSKQQEGSNSAAGGGWAVLQYDTSSAQPRAAASDRQPGGVSDCSPWLVVVVLAIK